MDINRVLFEAVQSLTGFGPVDDIMLFFAEFLVVLVPLSLVYLWFQDRNGKRDSVLVFTATVGGILVSYAMGLIYAHENPSAVYDTIVSMKPENAFPSQHTTAMFSAALPLLRIGRKRMGYLMFVAAVTTGFSRIYIGEHWPVDILGAFVASLFTLLVVRYGRSYTLLLVPVYQFSERIESLLKKHLSVNQ